MKVAKWGNSLAVRLPAELVKELGLKEGDELQLGISSAGHLEVERKLDVEEAIRRLRKYRGLMPKDFKFNREVANARR